MTLVLAAAVWAQSRSTLGFNIDYAYRTAGDPTIPSKMGVGMGVTGKLATPIPLLTFTLGGRYLFFPESNQVTATGNVALNSYDLWTPFLGIQLGKYKGPYLLVAETGEFRDKGTRFGLDAGVGYMVWNDEGKAKVDFSLKYALNNLMGKDPDEATRSYLLFGMGLAF